MKKNNGSFLEYIKSTPIAAKWRIWFVIPFIIILAGLMTFFIIGGVNNDLSQGINAGIDFTGGTILSVQLTEDDITDNYAAHEEKILAAIEEEEGVQVTYVQVTEGTASQNFALEFRYKNPSDNAAETEAANAAIKARIAALYSDYSLNQDNPEFITYTAISATASKTLITKSLLAALIAIVLILIYIMIRFEPMSAIAAIIAILHDVLIMFAFVIITRIQVNSSFVAAVITIISYSINNTIVIFDRVREIKKPYKGERYLNYEDIGDRAVRASWARSIYTTFTTMITILLLAIIGVAPIKEFTIPIIIGLIAGLYSSVFIATPLWTLLMRAQDKARAKRSGKPAYAGATAGEGKTKEIAPAESAAKPEKAKAPAKGADSDDSATEPQDKPKQPKKPQGQGQYRPPYKKKKNTKFK